MGYAKQLLDDALLFNPWVNKAKESDDIPEAERQEMLNKRMEWLKEDGST